MGLKKSCFNLCIIPAIPGNFETFASTFERQGEFKHLPVGQGLAAKMAPQCMAFTWICIEKKLTSPLFPYIIRGGGS